MTSFVTLFNFVEDNNEKITQQVIDEFNRDRPPDCEFPEAALTELVQKGLDGYIDLLVTSQTDELDPVYRAASEILVKQGSESHSLLQLPLVFNRVIRQLYAKEFVSSDSMHPVREFDQTLEDIEKTGHRAACRFVDVFQEELEKHFGSRSE